MIISTEVVEGTAPLQTTIRQLSDAYVRWLKVCSGGRFAWDGALDTEGLDPFDVEALRQYQLLLGNLLSDLDAKQQRAKRGEVPAPLICP